MRELTILDYSIIFFGGINLIRIVALLVGADIYELLAHIKKRRDIPNLLYYPTVSVIIPAHNEEKTILYTIESVLASNYPQGKMEVIIVDDGSTDKTLALTTQYKLDRNVKNMQVVHQENTGKANALNNGIRNYATCELVMCLDADSRIAKHAIRNATRYFEDPTVAALSANVKITDRGTFLNLIQKFEYIICYQMKRAQTLYNVEYIIGGIGSMFRRSVLDLVGYYDNNTVTEDIDLTMKIIRNGNKQYRAVYGSDVVAYTESCLSIAALIQQRFRWKWGRSQTFLKNKHMFFNPSSKFTKQLTFLYLPFALFSDLAFFFEPLLIGYMIFISLVYHDPYTLLMAFIVITAYLGINVLAETTLAAKEKLKLILLAPSMYIFFYILSFVEYVALIKAYANIFTLKASLEQDMCHWKHVDRPILTANI